MAMSIFIEVVMDAETLAKSQPSLIMSGTPIGIVSVCIKSMFLIVCVFHSEGGTGWMLTMSLVGYQSRPEKELPTSIRLCASTTVALGVGSF